MHPPAWFRAGALLVVTAALALPASASSSVTRLDVSWTGNVTVPPLISWFIGFDYQGECGGDTSPGSPAFCPARPGFHWVTANPNANLWPQNMSLVDDQPESARKVCFMVASDFYDGRYDINGTIIDPDGMQRATTYHLDAADPDLRKHSSRFECSPAGLPPQRTAPSAPQWFVDGRKVVRGYGGRCSSVKQLNIRQLNGHPQPVLETGVDCIYRSGVPHQNSFCNWGITTPRTGPGDDAFFVCWVYAQKRKPTGWCSRTDTRGVWVERTMKGKILATPRRLDDCLNALRSL